MRGEIEVKQEGMALLSDDPDEMIKRATKIANALKSIVDDKKMYVNISGRPYVKADGWATLGAMVGVFPKVISVERLSRENDEIAYNARVGIYTASGREVSVAEAMCSSHEKNWQGRDEFAIKSMSQTRATGKVFRLPFAWIVVLAGYEPTPAEEMTENGEASPPPSESKHNLKFIHGQAKVLGLTHEEIHEAIGCLHIDAFPGTDAQIVIAMRKYADAHGRKPKKSPPVESEDHQWRKQIDQQFGYIHKLLKDREKEGEDSDVEFEGLMARSYEEAGIKNYSEATLQQLKDLSSQLTVTYELLKKRTQ